VVTGTHKHGGMGDPTDSNPTNGKIPSL
jgi:hypothetical protein